jgi:hypothetical protein
MKFVERHPFADPDAAARKIIEIANGVEAAQDGRIFIERVNEPFLAAGGSGEEFRAGVERARAMVAMPFEDPKRWDAVVEQLKVIKQWPEVAPTDFEGHKKFVDENLDKLFAHKNMSLELELEALTSMYAYFDARRWRILKAKDDTGGFVTTDHPVCVHKPAALG